MNQQLSPPKRDVSTVLVFTSPTAGSGIGREQLPQLVQQLEGQGVSVCATSSIGVLREQTKDVQADQHVLPVVVAAGGDGTLSLVAESVPQGVPIVPMPLGTENLLARHLGYAADASGMVDTIRFGASHWIDAGRANGKLFLVTATCGFDAEVVRAMHLTRRGHIRRFHYAGPIVRALRRYRFPVIHVDVEDGLDDAGDKTTLPLSCCWAMTFNFPCYGGYLNIEPDAKGNDGLLDVITFQNGSIISGLRYLAGIVFGQHRRFGDVTRLRGRTVEFSSEQRVPYQLDGDYGGHLPLKIEMLPSHVHLLLPRQGKQS